MLIRYYIFQNDQEPAKSYDSTVMDPDTGLTLSYANIIATREELDHEILLEVLFGMFNGYPRPNAGGTRRSTSVGDVITLSVRKPDRSWYGASFAVEMIGFTKLGSIIQPTADEVLDLLYELEQVRPTPLLWKERAT